MRSIYCFSLPLLLLISASVNAEDPSIGQGYRYSFRILDERDIEWGVSAASQVRKEEGGYSAMAVYKAGTDYLISRMDLPDDPMAHFMNPESVSVNQLEFHLKDKVHIFVLQSTRQKTILVSEQNLENVEAYQYILDKTFKDGGQLFLDFLLCGDRIHNNDSGNAVGEKNKPAQDDPSEESGNAISDAEKLCSRRYRFIETDIPCSEIEGAVGLSCKEIDDAIFCRNSCTTFIQYLNDGNFKEFFNEVTEKYDRCRGDLMYFKLSIAFLMVSKYGKWYSDDFEAYLEKKKIDPVNYIRPSKPRYSDICGSLASYLFLKKKTNGLIALEHECEYGGMHYQVLQLARDGLLDGVKTDSKVAEIDLYKFLNPFLKGENLANDLLIEKCKRAHPVCHLQLALSRIATGKYDPSEFSEYYKYYPMFHDLVDEFAIRREQAIKAKEKAEKEKTAKAPAPVPAVN